MFVDWYTRLRTCVGQGWEAEGSVDGRGPDSGGGWNLEGKRGPDLGLG